MIIAAAPLITQRNNCIQPRRLASRRDNLARNEKFPGDDAEPKTEEEVMAAKKKKNSKIPVSVRDLAGAALEARRARASQLKKNIKAAKKELREIRRELKAAKKAAKKRLKAAQAETRKRLARLGAAVRRKRAALAKAIAPKPARKPAAKPAATKPVAKKPIVKKAAAPKTSAIKAAPAAAPKPALTAVERLDVIRTARVSIAAKPAPLKKPEATGSLPSVTAPNRTN